MRVCTKISKWLTALSKGGAEYGLIHYDFELDNLIWNNNGANIIDLDDCIQSWYVADIAYALRDLFPDGDFSPCRQYKAFLRGYSECFQFDTRWLWEIPKFYQVHAIVSLARLKRSLDISESTDNPQWMNELIGKLKAFCEKYRRMVTTAAVWD